MTDLSGSLDSAGRPSGRVAGPRASSGLEPTASSGLGPTSASSGLGRAPAASSSHGSTTGRPTSSRAGPAGRAFGAYTLESELGRGANGVVFLARCADSTQVALKVLKDDLAQDEESLQRFRLEAAVAWKLDHPGVVRTLDAGIANGHHFIAMEYCPGETLAQRLVRGPLPVEEARGLVLELARTLGYAHSQGVIHRDVKPGNVILDPGTGRPRLTDFGLSRDRSLARSLTRSGDVLGTPAYMSPEQFRAQKDVDARADVYGLGAVLYECLTGRRPFPATVLAELAVEVLEGPLTSPRTLAPAVPPAMEVICLKALARERDERYRDGGELARALEAAGPGGGPRGSSEAAAPRARAPRRTTGRPVVSPGQRRLLLVGAGLLVAGLVVGGLISLAGRPARLAREALAGARSLVEDGGADPAATAEAVARAETAAAEAGVAALIEEAGGLRADLARAQRVDAALGARETSAADLVALTGELRERSRQPRDRWDLAAGLVEARRVLGEAAAGNDRRLPPAEVRAALDRVKGLAQDPRLRPALEREQARLAARELLAETRQRWNTEWLASQAIPQALARVEQAAAELDPALADEARLEQARYQLQRGRLEEAQERARSLLDRPGRVAGDAAILIGTALAWQGWFTEGMQAFEQAAELAGRDSVPGLKAGAMVRSFMPGAEAGGADLARRACELDPEDVEAQVLLAVCRGTAGEMDAALAELERLARAHPADTTIPVMRMLMLERANEVAGSDAAMKEALRRASEDGKFLWFLRGLSRLMPRPGEMGRGRRGGMSMEVMDRMNRGMEDMREYERQAPQDIRPRMFQALIDAMFNQDFTQLGTLRQIAAEDPKLTDRFLRNFPDQRIGGFLRMALGGGRR